MGTARFLKMTWKKSWFALVGLSFLINGVCTEIRVGGTGNALGSMHLLAQAYETIHPEVKIVILPSIGSSGALRAIKAGAIDIGISARDLSDADREFGLRSFEYARTATVFAVRNGNPASSITTKEIADIYRGTKLTWNDGTHIRPILRQPGDDNYSQIANLDPEIKLALLIARDRQGLPFASTDQEAVDKAESIPGSLVVTALSLILSEQRALKPLRLNGVAPDSDALQTGKYPLIKRFFIILPSSVPAEVEQFLNFVNSADGRRLLSDCGHVFP